MAETEFEQRIQNAGRHLNRVFAAHLPSDFDSSASQRPDSGVELKVLCGCARGQRRAIFARFPRDWLRYDAKGMSATGRGREHHESI